MKTYRYAWPKQDGTRGLKETSSAEAMLRFISDGEKDRTFFAETRGLFSVTDLTDGSYEAMTFATVIQTFLKEVEALRQQKTEPTQMDQHDQESA